jgi:hypothetical protein
MRRIAENAVDIAKTYTSFSQIRDAWTSKMTTGGKFGLADTLTVFNREERKPIVYRSKWSNSGKSYKMPWLMAIGILEHGRKGGYSFFVKRAGALTIPPYYVPKKKRSKDGKVGFAQEVEINKSVPATKPLTKALAYMKSEVEGKMGEFKREGIENTVLSRTPTSKLGKYKNYTNVRHAKRGRR